MTVFDTVPQSPSRNKKQKKTTPDLKDLKKFKGFKRFERFKCRAKPPGTPFGEKITDMKKRKRKKKSNICKKNIKKITKKDHKHKKIKKKQIFQKMKDTKKTKKQTPDLKDFKILKRFKRLKTNLIVGQNLPDPFRGENHRHCWEDFVFKCVHMCLFSQADLSHASADEHLSRSLSVQVHMFRHCADAGMWEVWCRIANTLPRLPRPFWTGGRLQTFLYQHTRHV